VWIVIAGGLAHCGVLAYLPDHMKGPFVDLPFDKKELIPGLWYYDDRYSADPSHQKRIDSLIQEGKKRQPLMQATNRDANAPK
jgi:hypothetical protein